MEEPCDRCGSTAFHDEDGKIVCHNGHDQGRTVTAEDDADFGRQGTVVRKKVDKVKVRTSKGQDSSSLLRPLTERRVVLHGAKAYHLFLQCWQFILWKQCHVLVHQKGLPAELWVSSPTDLAVTFSSLLVFSDPFRRSLGTCGRCGSQDWNIGCRKTPPRMKQVTRRRVLAMTVTRTLVPTCQITSIKRIDHYTCPRNFLTPLR